jgi:hypothetical protein
MYPKYLGVYLTRKYSDLEGIAYAYQDGEAYYLHWDEQAMGAPKPTPEEVEADARAVIADYKREQIDTEFEQGATTALGFPMTIPTLDWWTETYLKILAPEASNPITEADTPLWHTANQWRAARNELLKILNAAIACEGITVEMIYDFDVTQDPRTMRFCGVDYVWSGWPTSA